jgi:hypothetical protein
MVATMCVTCMDSALNFSDIKNATPAKRPSPTLKKKFFASVYKKRIPDSYMVHGFNQEDSQALKMCQAVNNIVILNFNDTCLSKQEVVQLIMNVLGHLLLGVDSEPLVSLDVSS